MSDNEKFVNAIRIGDRKAFDKVCGQYYASIDEIVSEEEREYHVALDCMSKDTTRRYTFNYQRSNTLEEVLQIISFMTGADVQITKKQ